MFTRNKILLLLFSSILFTIGVIAASSIAMNRKVSTSLASDSNVDEFQSSQSNAEPTEGMPTIVTEVDARRSLTFTLRSTATPTPTPQITTTSVNVGIVVDDYANKNNTITSLEKQTAVSLSTVAIFKQFGNANSRLNQSDLAYTKSSGKKLLIAWEPWNPEEGMDQTKDYLKEIINGKEDSYLTNFAQDIKTYDAPVTIRFAHEMNGNWYPWGNRAEEYKNAYKHIVDLFKSQDVTNVSWMWSINADSVPTAPIADASAFYPGDSYADLIGIDGYNFGNSQPTSSWRTFSNIFEDSYIFVSTYNKPIILSEMASSEQGGNKAEWIAQMDKDLSTKFPKVTEIIWFNLLKETDWRIESTSSSLASFKEVFGN